MQVMQSVVNDLFGDSSSLLKTLNYQISQHCFPRFEATLPDHIVLKASGLIEVNQDNVVQSIDEKSVHSIISRSFVVLGFNIYHKRFLHFTKPILLIVNSSSQLLTSSRPCVRDQVGGFFSNSLRGTGQACSRSSLGASAGRGFQNLTKLIARRITVLGLPVWMSSFHMGHRERESDELVITQETGIWSDTEKNDNF